VADEDREAKTEAATQRRLDQAREKGQIALGRDLPAVASLAAGVAGLFLLADSLGAALGKLVTAGLEAARTGTGAGLLPAIRPVVLLVLAACGCAALGGLAAGLFQTRGGFWPHLAAPDPARLKQGGALKIFRREGLVDLLLGLVKVVAVGWVLWLSLRDDFLALPGLVHAPERAGLRTLFAPLAGAAVNVLATMAVLAGLDLALARHRFAAKMRMTKEETKRELKEDEGDPLLRGRRRRKHRDLARARIAVEVPRADAIVVNPTHLAIAIRYRRDEGRAPRVTAKGKGPLAERMRDLAREHGVPIVENVPLARLLYRRVKVGREIPADTYKAVAAILAFVYRITGRAPGGGLAA
jgi:flagellar biosynthetic protein FlhB